MAVLAYYVYRYNFYRLVIKPGLIYSIIYGMVMAIYLLGIRRLGEYLSQFPEVNAEFIEGILLVALVFIFQPFRTQIQNRLDKIFFKDKYYYQQFLRELTDSISGIVDLQKLLQTLSAALVSALKAKACTLVVFRMNEGEPQIYKTYGNHELHDIHILIDALLATRRFRLRRQMRDHRVVLALRKNNIELAIPIHFQDDLIGLVCLTEKRNGSSYSDEELDVLQTFANQVGLAFENARLVQDRLDLEAKVFQAEKLHSLGQLATTLAHEVKNPLSSIKTIIQVLHERAVGEEAEDLRIVLHEIDRLNAVLEKLLTFARPTTTEFESIKVPEIVQEVADLLKHQVRKSNIKIDFRVANSLPEIRT
ncbi:MAG TPA: sensor histidine kinase, partial [Planctomycetaceae bacterium]|nr:sensor histidine kinase [Planctomycetaceae bacterium]